MLGDVFSNRLHSPSLHGQSALTIRAQEDALEEESAEVDDQKDQLAFAASVVDDDIFEEPRRASSSGDIPPEVVSASSLSVSASSSPRRTRTVSSLTDDENVRGTPSASNEERRGTTSAGGTPSLPTSAGGYWVSTLEPTQMPTVSDRNKYGWDPWSKVPVRVSTERLPWSEMRKWVWEPANPAWWVAFFWFTGGVCFTVGAVCSLPTSLRTSGPSPSWYFYTTLVSYFVGSVLFTTGSIILLWESVREQAEMYELHVEHVGQTPSWASDSESWRVAILPGEGQPTDGWRIPRRRYGSTTSPSPASSPSPSPSSFGERLWPISRGTQVPRGEDSTEESPLLAGKADGASRSINDMVAEHYVRPERRARASATWSDPWCRLRFVLDVTGAWVLVVGVQAYNVMIVAEMLEADMGRRRSDGHFARDLELWLVTIPCDFGGFCFMVCSWLYFVSSNGTFSPTVFRPRSRSYWISWLGLVGSVGFFLGPLAPASLQASTRIDGLVSNWLGLALGYGVGSVLFVVQGYLMILHLANVDRATQRVADRARVRRPGR